MPQPGCDSPALTEQCSLTTAHGLESGQVAQADKGSSVWLLARQATTMWKNTHEAPLEPMAMVSDLEGLALASSRDVGHLSSILPPEEPRSL